MYLRPRTVHEACEALAVAPATILSGGTDVFPALGDGPLPSRMLDLSRVGGLSDIAREHGRTRIGGRVTWTRLVKADLPPCFDGLKAAAREIGSIQIQNAATLAGNLCNASPAADGAPPLLALDASVELTSLAGTRRLTLPEFLLGNRRTARRPDEVLTAILVPSTIERGRAAFLKLGARRYLVISIAMVAAIVEQENGRVGAARVAVGSCSAVARRLPALEAALVGAEASGLADLVRPEHLAPLSPIDDLRASAEYRMEAALELVRRALDACSRA